MKVEVSSQDVEAMLLAIGFLKAMREQITDSEMHARMAIAENTLHRIAYDAMLQSPVAKAFLAAAESLKEPKP